MHARTHIYFHLKAASLVPPLPLYLSTHLLYRQVYFKETQTPEANWNVGPGAR